MLGELLEDESVAGLAEIRQEQLEQPLGEEGSEESPGLSETVGGDGSGFG